jgi:hypothetical protein
MARIVHAARQNESGVVDEATTPLVFRFERDSRQA